MKISNYLLCLIILLLLSNFAAAIRISPDSIRIEFEPNFEETYTFHTQKADNTVVYIEGYLAEYVTVMENNIAKDGTFVIKVKLPAEIETPGKNLVFVGVTEGSKAGGTVSGVASIRTPIDIRVPYPGVYAETGFNAYDLNINETANFDVTINNLGKVDISSAKAVIDIININNNIVEKLFTEEKAVKTNTLENFGAFFDASKHAAGTYSAVAHITYDDQSKDLEAGFKIGTLNIKILNYTKTIFKDTIVKFNIEIESVWNREISNVYAEIKIINNTKEVSSFKTVSVNVKPWEKKIISTFWDAEGLGEGNYNIEITLFYEGETTKLKEVIEVMTIEERVSLYEKYFNTTSLMIAVIVLLILFNILILAAKRKNKNTPARKYTKKPKK